MGNVGKEVWGVGGVEGGGEVELALPDMGDLDSFHGVSGVWERAGDELGEGGLALPDMVDLDKLHGGGVGGVGRGSVGSGNML